MSVAFVQEWDLEGDDRSTTNYDLVASKLGEQGGTPEGLLAHAAGFSEDAGVFRILDVWESKEQAQKFLDETLMPIVTEFLSGQRDAGPPTRQYFYELHDFVSP
jgi:hypothetical protein